MLPGAPGPLALFRAARVDYSLHRLYHYTGTDPEHFQNFVIFTNYQFYVDAFSQLCHERMLSGQPGYDAFVEPGNVVTRNKRLGGGTSGVASERIPQMPALHLVEPGFQGITMINIGTGPSNARTITDHVAVLRPHAWLMLGHCVKPRRLADFVRFLVYRSCEKDHRLASSLWVEHPNRRWGKEAVPVWTRFDAQLPLNARFLCHPRAVRSGQRIKRHVVFLAAQPEIAERALGDAGRQLEAIDQVR